MLCWKENCDRLYEELRENEAPEVAKELLNTLYEAIKQKLIDKDTSFQLS